MGNIQLLKDVRDAILLDPKSHDQKTWVCDTSMCIAGHAAVMSGRAKVSKDTDWGVALVDDEGEYVNASYEAEEVLELTDSERRYLFYCMDNEVSIKRMNQIIALWEEGKTLEDMDPEDRITYEGEDTDDDY